MQSYAGRDIVGRNSDFGEDKVDGRGYVPVEWWVMSKTVALNEKPKENEGVTLLHIGPDLVPFTTALGVASDLLLGVGARTCARVSFLRWCGIYEYHHTHSHARA